MARKPTSRPSSSGSGASASKKTTTKSTAKPRGTKPTGAKGKAGTSATKSGAAKKGTAAASRNGVTKASAARSAKNQVKKTPIRKHFIDYPRAGRKGFKRWLPSWRLILGAFLGCMALGVGAVYMAYSSVTIPDANEFAVSQKTTVYYADGTTVMGTFMAQDRQIVDTKEFKNINNAIVSAEDAGFWDNSGIDIRGISRALYQNIFGSGNQQGASTITQQYVKNYYLTADKTWQRKVNEAILAVKIDRQTDKADILDSYLNTIYFGRQTYGIQSATKAYFGDEVNAADLTLEQAALLAGIVPSPNKWDPADNPEKATQRWNYVLDQLEKNGHLDKTTRAGMVFPATIPKKEATNYDGTTGFLMHMVQNEFIQQTGNDSEALERGGYSIVTTIDPTVQRLANEAIATIPEDHDPNLRSSLVAINPADGAIIALNGGYYSAVDTEEFGRANELNNAVSAPAQAASTMKPFGLVAALETKKYSLKSRFDGDDNIIIKGAGKQHNFGNHDYGNIDLLKATEQSVNTAYMGLNVEMGPELTTDAFVRATGIDRSKSPFDKGTRKLFPDTANNILGTGAVSTKQLATGFATFASQGTYHETHIITDITFIDQKTSEKATFYSFKGVGEKVFDTDVMADVTYALTQVVQNGTGKTAKGVGRPVAGKTGTSNGNKAAWFAGYTTDIAVVVGLSQDGELTEDGKSTEGSISPMGKYKKKEITGSTVPLDVWTTFTKSVYKESAFKDLPVGKFPKAANVGSTPPETVEPTEEITETPVDPGVNPEQPAPPTQTTTAPPITTDTKVTVPPVVGRTQEEAIAAFNANGVKYTISLTNSSRPNGTVLSTNPAAGTKVSPAISVTIMVSTGAPTEPDDG